MFEGFDEAFCEGVVVGVSFAAHAYLDAVFVKQVDVVVACVLDSLIRVMHET